MSQSDVDNANQKSADDDSSLAGCFKVNIFQIDYYNTKPVYSHDKTFSIFRGKNVKVTTVVRIFGSTDDGEKALNVIVVVAENDHHLHRSLQQASKCAFTCTSTIHILASDRKNWLPCTESLPMEVDSTPSPMR